MKNPLKAKYDPISNVTIFSYSVYKAMSISNPELKPLTDREMRAMKKQVKSIILTGIKKDLNIHD